MFLRRLHDYQKDNRKIADIAIKKFINHLWYLSDECIAFAIFDNRVTIEEKRKMALKIMNSEVKEEEETKKKCS